MITWITQSCNLRANLALILSWKQHHTSKYVFLGALTSLLLVLAFFKILGKSEKRWDEKLLSWKTSLHGKDESRVCCWLDSERFVVSSCTISLVEWHISFWIRGDLNMSFCHSWLVWHLDGIVLSELSVYEYIIL